MLPFVYKKIALVLTNVTKQTPSYLKKKRKRTLVATQTFLNFFTTNFFLFFDFYDYDPIKQHPPKQR